VVFQKQGAQKLMASCDLWNMNVTGLFISNGMVNEKHYL